MGSRTAPNPGNFKRFAHRSLKELAADIKAWAENWNKNTTSFLGHKTADQILQHLAGYCATIKQNLSEST